MYPLIIFLIGSAAHSVFDFGLWHLIACGHCQKRGDQTVGWSIAVIITMLSVSVAIVMIYIRGFRSGDVDDAEQNPATDNNSTGIEQAFYYAFEDEQADFTFLLVYLIEVLIALFVFAPLMSLVVFSGVMGCGCMPFLSGRPGAMRNERKQKTMVEV